MSTRTAPRARLRRRRARPSWRPRSATTFPASLPNAAAPVPAPPATSMSTRNGRTWSARLRRWRRTCSTSPPTCGRPRACLARSASGRSSTAWWSRPRSARADRTAEEVVRQRVRREGPRAVAPDHRPHLPDHDRAERQGNERSADRAGHEGARRDVERRQRQRAGGRGHGRPDEAGLAGLEPRLRACAADGLDQRGDEIAIGPDLVVALGKTGPGDRGERDRAAVLQPQGRLVEAARQLPGLVGEAHARDGAEIDLVDAP